MRHLSRRDRQVIMSMVFWLVLFPLWSHFMPQAPAWLQEGVIGAAGVLLIGALVGLRVGPLVAAAWRSLRDHRRKVSR